MIFTSRKQTFTVSGLHTELGRLREELRQFSIDIQSNNFYRVNGELFNMVFDVPLVHRPFVLRELNKLGAVAG